MIETDFIGAGFVGVGEADGEADGEVDGTAEGAGFGAEPTLCVLGLEGLTGEKVSDFEVISQPEPMIVAIAAKASDLCLSLSELFIPVAPIQVSKLKLLRFERQNVSIKCHESARVIK